MARAILQRRWVYRNVEQPDGTREDATIGELFVEDDNGEVIFKSYTLENGGKSTDESGRDKRIVARKYRLKWHSSSKNKALGKKYSEFKLYDGRNQSIQLYTPELPSFEKRYILIHAGNYSMDTLGCILLGDTERNGFVFNSVDCVARFYRLCRDKLDLDKLELEIREKEAIE